MVNWRKMEIITKGIASHRRLAVMDLLKEKPELSVEEVAMTLKLNSNNVSRHIGCLLIAGLVMKRHDGNFVRHKLTNRGQIVLKFLRTLE